MAMPAARSIYRYAGDGVCSDQRRWGNQIADRNLVRCAPRPSPPESRMH